MKISVIIPTYNEAKLIGNCLRSLDEQSLAPDEVIVINDGSTDETVDRLQKFRASDFEFRILRQPHRGAGAARNAGVRVATGEILVFVDADMEFDTDFLKDLTEPIRNKRAKGTFSKEEYVKNWDNQWARAWQHCLGLRTERNIPEDFPSHSPVFRAILKQEFDKAGGFDESRGYNDDWTLSEKLGYKAVLASGARYYHHNPDTLVEIFRQARWRASRRYKGGALGSIVVLAKTTLLLVTFFAPLWQTIRFGHLPSFFARITYDFGVITGIIRHLLTQEVKK